MRFRRRNVALDDILQFTRKHLAVGVAGQASRFVGRKYNDNGSRDVAGRIRAHPRVVIFGFGRRAGGRVLGVGVVGIVGVGSLSALLDFFVALEVECFWHGGCVESGRFWRRR